ncbi:hypothetical protein RclHR1_06150013 [Rhizophagus clarus]|uniref:Kinase-like domain-containing protein n=1 Tax=Rhizophagus clarus TaxID=94130 RepID=A0A2Z6SHK9_9GLOM|nr:hypothetical protein RclHR1_06150013 [Rhizophagus clarus]GES98890.1 kinase-like domain-containing protein [Rhizophagus clarus]
MNHLSDKSQIIEYIEPDDDVLGAIEGKDELHNENISGTCIKCGEERSKYICIKCEKYYICIKCGKERSHYQWCQPCERKISQESFTKWTSENKEIDKFLQESQLNSTKPQTFLEWIPFEKLENIKYLGNSERTLYSAVWMDGPRILWDQQNQEYKRSKVQVLVEEKQVNEILDELKIYLDCHLEDCVLLIQFYGISKHPKNNEYFIIKQYSQNGSLYKYISENSDNIDWEIRLHLLFYLAEDLKVLHNAGYVHRNFNPIDILVFDNSLCAISSLSKCHKILSLSKPKEIFGWQRYMAPEFLRYKPYTKACDIYSFGMIMYTVGTGMIPYYKSDDDHFLSLGICSGLRPKISINIPESFSKLVKRCWDDNPNFRPDISEICDTLLKWWSSVYHKYLSPTCLEFLVADKRNSSKFKILIKNPDVIETKDIILPDNKDLEPSEFIDFIVRNHLVKYINLNELSSTMEYVESGHFGTISKTIWKKTNSKVICKRIKNIESINHKLMEAFLHELNMHKRVDFCSRIIRILGISFDEITKEYLFIMQYADGGNLRNYLNNHFSELNWKDHKIKLAYQITEGIKYLHGENILHRDLHSKNIVIHEGEAKIIDLGIAKSTETETHLHSGVFGVIPYVDPKLLESDSYKYDKKSDIYSLGVLMWELSSGHPPFYDVNDLKMLTYNLLKGNREKTVPNTPYEYMKLYQSCWDGEPDERPSVEQVFYKLVEILNIYDDDDIIDTSFSQVDLDTESDKYADYRDPTLDELVF